MWDPETRARRAAEPPAPPPGTEVAAVAGDELAALVSGIVAVTLDTRLADCTATRRAAIGRELEARLLALFAAPPVGFTLDVHEDEDGDGNARDGAHEAAPDEETDSEPAAPRALAPAPERELVLEYGSPAARALGLVLENRLAGLGGALSERADLRQRLIQLALQILEAPRAPDGPPATPEELRDLELLQRRAFKLERSLDEARSALAYVSGLERVDEGIASIYRAVQGLEPADPQRERKREALEGIFRANLELQRPDAGQ